MHAHIEEELGFLGPLQDNMISILALLTGYNMIIWNVYNYGVGGAVFIPFPIESTVE